MVPFGSGSPMLPAAKSEFPVAESPVGEFPVEFPTEFEEFSPVSKFSGSR